ncbi:hypothetical protein [Streptomyces monomycini]|uniref:hypothetical protein n=1 Tax=Streptomyces monomycini TaxID=371720 RepID=UPI0012FEF347|nr:hypothetical protein [Streptomyces monomycini]
MMKPEVWVASFSAAVALGAAAMSVWATRGVSSKESFALARSLYCDLTSESTSAARSALEFYWRGERRSVEQTRQVLDHYFALLWCFERIRAGRESLARQRRLNGTGPALRYLDEMIRWHVEEWARRWARLRRPIQQHIGELDDHHSIRSFCHLAHGVVTEPDARQAVTDLLDEIDAEAARQHRGNP